MSHDPSLFDSDTDWMLIRGDVHPATDIHGLARYGDPQTSVEAAQRISGRTERLIVAAFRTQKAYEWSADIGFTDDEICDALASIHGPTVKSARSRLSRAGLLVDSGETRLSGRGSRMTVWKLKGHE